MPDALVRIALEADDATAGADRFSQALHRIERSEPSRALRQTRFAVDELTTAATGLHPALGRLAGTLTQFGIGGAIGIAATGGLAAIGLEVKALLNIVPNLEEQFRKLNTEFANMGGPGAVGLARLTAIQDRLAALGEPGIWERIASGMSRSGLVAGFIGRAALAGPLAGEQIGRATEGATLHNELLRAHAESMKLHADALKKHADELTHLRQITGRGFVRPGAALAAGIAATTPGAFLEGADQRGDIRGRGRGPGRAGGFFTFDEAGRVLQDPNAPENTPVGPRLPEANRPSDRRNLELSIGAALSVVSSLAQGGGGAVLGGLGSASTALSGLKGISGGAANILGPLGIGLSAVSSLFGLFGHHEPAHVIIDGYDSRAMTQQQQLLVALTGFKGLNIELLGVGGDPRALAYALGRQSRTDGNMRLPPGGVVGG